MSCGSRDTQPRACGGLESWMAVFDTKKKGENKIKKHPPHLEMADVAVAVRGDPGASPRR